MAKPKHKYSRWFQWLVLPLVSVGFKLYFGHRVIGRENIPEGACVVCGNHSQLSDPPLVAVALTHRAPIRIMAKKELFSKRLLGPLITWLGAFPVDRQSADLAAIKTALGAVRAGQKLLIFPQGTRGAHEGETKKGAAMLAVRTRAPILPVYIDENKHFLSRPRIIIGKPYLPDANEKDYSIIADDILRRIYALRGQRA